MHCIQCISIPPRRAMVSPAPSDLQPSASDTVPRRTSTTEWRRNGPSAIDDHDATVIAEPVKHRRGRPRGSKTTLVTSGKQLTAFDFSFLRATVEGIDPITAARLYLPELKAHEVDAYLRDLARRLTLTVESAPANQAEMQRLLHIALHDPEPVEPPKKDKQSSAPSRPTLDEFRSRFDEDVYGEAELLELYQEEFGGNEINDSPEIQIETPVPYGTASRIEALHSLQALLVKQVNPRDPVGLWFDVKLAAALSEHHVHTVSDLARWLNQTGRRWYERVPGIGRARASRVVAWLASNEGGTGVILSSTFREFGTALHGIEDIATNQLLPLEQIVWPEELLGVDGKFRSSRTNTLTACNDREAVFAWLGNLSEKSQDTLVAYRRAIERLVLWALLVKKTAISSLNSGHIIEFKDFLRSPPAAWCGETRKMKSSRDWRPLRGPAGDQTIQLTLSAVNKMFKDWRASNYLAADSAALVSSGSRREMKMDVMRSFSEQDLLCIAQTLDHMPDSPRRRRLRAAILLLQTAGVRRAEAVGLTWGHVHRVREANVDSEQWAIKFLGKGRRERIVPIQQYLVDALNAHFEDRRGLIISGKLGYYARISKEDSPLLSILDERLAMDAPGSDGDAPHNAARSVNRNGGLSTSRLYGIVRAFFREVAGLHPNTSADFLTASTHWLRHTYAHQVLISAGGDLNVAKELLGHADISTTAIYTKADMSSRIKAVNRIKPAV